MIRKKFDGIKINTIILNKEKYKFQKILK